MITRNKFHVLFVTESSIDVVYRSLKSKYMHFVIIMDDGGIADNFRLRKDLDIAYIHSASGEKERVSKGFAYQYIVLYTELAVLNVSSILRAEKTMDAQIPKDFSYAFSIHLPEYEYRKYPVYISSDIKRDTRNIAVIINTKGYGNSIIDMPILQKYCMSKILHGFQIEFWHTYPESLHLSEVFMPNASHIVNPLMDNNQAIDQMLGGLPLHRYSQIVNMDALIIRSSYSKFDDLCRFFHVENSSSLLDDLEIHTVALAQDIIDRLYELHCKYKHTVGVQFQTHDDKICATKRSWNPNHIMKLIELCHCHSIGVINLTPYDGPPIPFDMDCSGLTIAQLFSAYAYLDAYVGIESVCAHIAGIMQKDNLMLLGKVVDHVSQRPLSNNYTLLSKSGEIDDIEPHIVANKLRDMLSKNIVLNSFKMQNNRFEMNDDTIIKV